MPEALARGYLGPEGGSEGGLIVAEGTPEQVAANPASHTGRFLQHVLGPAEQTPSAPEKRKQTNKQPPRHPL